MRGKNLQIPQFLKKTSFPFLLISESFKVFLIYFLGLLVLMGCWRFLFLLSQFSQINFTDFFLFLQSFWVALRLDAVVISYFCLPIFLTLFLCLGFHISFLFQFLYFSFYFLRFLLSLFFVFLTLPKGGRFFFSI